MRSQNSPVTQQANRRKQKWRTNGLRTVILLILLLHGCKKDYVDEIDLEAIAVLPEQHPIVVVNFWATWCPPCLQEIPYFVRLHKTRPDVHVVGISVDDPALDREVFKFVKQYRLPYPVYLRERLDQESKGPEWATSVDMVPVTYIFKEAKLHNTIYGAVEKWEELQDAIDKSPREYLDSGDDENNEDDDSEESSFEEED